MNPQEQKVLGPVAVARNNLSEFLYVYTFTLVKVVIKGFYKN